MVEKRKERILILFEPQLALARFFALRVETAQLLVKLLYFWLVFVEKSRLEAVSVDGRNHWPDEVSKVSDQQLQFFVERLGQQIIVEVTDEVNQALLLGAFAIVCRIKVATKNAVETSAPMDKVAFPRLRIQVDNFVQDW